MTNKREDRQKGDDETSFREGSTWKRIFVLSSSCAVDRFKVIPCLVGTRLSMFEREYFRILGVLATVLSAERSFDMADDRASTDRSSRRSSAVGTARGGNSDAV